MKSKISHIVLAVTLLIILSSLTLTAFGPSAVAYAADGSNAVNFDNTDVLDDLKGSALNGVPFDVNNYPYNPDGEIQLLSFVEYCYSDYENLRGNYGLYLYIYNPALCDIATGTGSNRIEMAVEYDENGNASEFRKFDLQVCSISKGTAANRFWKFKVLNHNFADSVDATERRYDISSVEFYVYGEELPKDYEIMYTFRYTGFAEGYGSVNQPLDCTVQEFEGIDLNVHHTSFLANVSPKGRGHYNQVSSVYFAVPNRFFDSYGYLYDIALEWFEYKLKPLMVTKNDNLYNVAQAYTKYQLKGYKDDYVKFNLWYDFEVSPVEIDGVKYETRDWVFNIFGETPVIGSSVTYNYISDEYADMMPLVFKSATDNPYVVFDFLNKYKSAGSVSSNELLEAIYAYSNDLGHGYINVPGRNISNDLFYDFVDTGRTKGYNFSKITLDDTFDLSNWETEHSSWWDKFKEWGFNAPEFGEEYKNISPIYELKDSDFISGNNEEIAKRLMVNKSDVAQLQAFYEENKRDNHIIICRFATTDYFSHEVGYADYVNGFQTVGMDMDNYGTTSDTYVSSQTAFFNLDIISLGFMRDGDYRAFAVVSDPIDVVGDVEPPAPPEWADDLEEAGQKIADFFKSIGDWFKENWIWFVVAIGVILALIALALIIRIIAFARGNKVTVEVRPESSTKRASRSYTKRVPGNKAGRKDGRKGG